MNATRLALAALLACVTLAPAQDPSKDPRYEEFRKAKLVLAAKLDAAKVTAVAESFPPQYQFSITLSPTEVYRGEFARGKAVTARHSITSVNEPKLPVGKEMLVQLVAVGNAFRIVKMEEATDELKAVAKAAASAGKAEQEKEDEIARKEPERHPRFKEFKEAAGLAVVALDRNGSVGFDVATRTSVYDLKAAEVLKGDLKPGAFKGHTKAQRQPPALRWLVTYKVEDGKVWLDSVDEVTETLLLVARAAVKK
jgi:hypothetical protein